MPKWADDPKVFSSYLRAMRKHGQQQQKQLPGYNVTTGVANMCGPVPRKALALEHGEIAHCADACTDLGQDCVGFIVDTASTKCLFRSWYSLTNCFERHRAVLQVDSGYSIYLKQGLSLASVDLRVA
jgi:hypothetical protein